MGISVWEVNIHHINLLIILLSYYGFCQGPISLLDIRKVFSPLFHFFPFSPAVVMLVNNFLTRVCPVTDNLPRHITAQGMGHTTSSNIVRTHT